MEQLGLAACTIVGTPGASSEGRTKEDCGDLLTGQEETQYRALYARANYLVPDRADIDLHAATGQG